MSLAASFVNNGSLRATSHFRARGGGGGGFLSRIYWVDDEGAGLRGRKKKVGGGWICVLETVWRKRGVEAVQGRRRWSVGAGLLSPGTFPLSITPTLKSRPLP